MKNQVPLPAPARDDPPPHPYINPPPFQHAYHYHPHPQYNQSPLPHQPLRRTSTPTTFPSVAVSESLTLSSHQSPGLSPQAQAQSRAHIQAHAQVHPQAQVHAQSLSQSAFPNLAELGEMALPELLKGIDPSIISDLQDEAPEVYARLLNQPAPTNELPLDIHAPSHPSPLQTLPFSQPHPQSLQHPHPQPQLHHPHPQPQLHHPHQQPHPTHAQISSMLDHVVSATTSPSPSQHSPSLSPMHMCHSMPVSSIPLNLHHQQMLGFMPRHTVPSPPSHDRYPHAKQLAVGSQPQPQVPIATPMSRSHPANVVAVAAAAAAAASAATVRDAVRMEEERSNRGVERGMGQRGGSPRASGRRRRARVGEKRRKEGRGKESGRPMVNVGMGGTVMGRAHERGNIDICTGGMEVKEEVLLGHGIGISEEDIDGIPERFEVGEEKVEIKKAMRVDVVGSGIGLEIEDIEGISGGVEDGEFEGGEQEVEKKKAMRAERNRQSAAASRERKKLHIRELERRVAMLSQENAALQYGQFGFIEERIEKERVLVHKNSVLKEQVVLKDMAIVGLSRELKELKPEKTSTKEALRRPKTWDAAEWTKENNAARKV